MSPTLDTVYDGELWPEVVDHIIALASQSEVLRITTTEEGDLQAVEPSNPVFQPSTVTRKVTSREVELWASRVLSQVLVAVHPLRRFTAARRAPFTGAIMNVTELGAAAYLVDAAFPARAGVNDNASYGDVLWTRHRQALDQLVVAVTAEAEAPTTETGALVGGAGRFPEPLFTDEWVREGHAPGLIIDLTAADGAEQAIRWR